MMFTFSLTLIRHGETQYNRDKLLQGQGVDTLLSEVGALQAEAAGLYLRDVHFSHVYVSNLQRACQTAEKIMRKNAHCPGQQMALEPLLRERGFGIAEGRPKEDLKNMAKAAGQSCRDYTPPGGETLEQVKQRFRRFLKLLFQQMVDAHGWSEQGAAVATSTDAGGDVAAGADDAPPAGSPDDGLGGVAVHVLVVSHGAYIRVAVRHLLGALQGEAGGARAARQLSPCPNTGLTRFVLTLRRAPAGPVLSGGRCVFTNRKDHLAGLGHL